MIGTSWSDPETFGTRGAIGAGGPAIPDDAGGDFFGEKTSESLGRSDILTMADATAREPGRDEGGVSGPRTRKLER